MDEVIKTSTLLYLRALEASLRYEFDMFAMVQGDPGYKTKDPWSRARHWGMYWWYLEQYHSWRQNMEAALGSDARLSSDARSGEEFLGGHNFD